MGTGPSKPMILQLFTVTKEKAQTTLIERVGILLSACKDYVKVQHRDDFYAFEDDENERRTPWIFTGEGFEFPNNIKIYAGSQDRHVLGEDVFGGMLDEAEFRIGCFSYGTKIILPDGKKVPIGELAEGGKEFYVYSWDLENESPCIEKATAFFTKVSEILEVHLDNGEVVECTPDHKFLLSTGVYVEAQSLKENDSLMALYKNVDSKGYPQSLNLFTGEWIFDHHLADQYNERYGFCNYDFSKGKYVRHHIDFDKTNNNPTNIVKMGFDEHWKYHSELKKSNPYSNNTRWKDNRDQMLENCSKGGKVASVYLNSNEEIIKKRNKSHSETLAKPESRKMLLKRAEVMNKRLQEEPWRRNYDGHQKRMSDRNSDPEYQRKCQEGRRKAKEARLKEKELEINEVIVWNDSPEVVRNHQVVKIVRTNRVEPVYDLTVPRTHNFALASGVFVHNSKGMVDKAFTLYDNIYERIRSRFLGIRYTLMCLLSSIAHEKGVMATHINQLRNDPNGKVSQYSIWDTKYPDALRHDGHFWVMRGTQRHPSRVLLPEEGELAEKDKFDLPPSCTIVKVPNRYKRDFERRTEQSLMNLAGQASMGQETPFDDLSRIEDMSLCPILYVSAPLGNANQTIPAPLRDQLPKDLFIPTPEGWRFRRYPAATRYAHWDGAAVSSAGLAVVHKELSRTGKVFYVADLILRITSPNRINLESVKEFIIDLRDYYGLGFKTFTADQYQSEQLLQKLNSIGFAETVEVLSVEKTRNPYDTLSNIVAQDCLKVGMTRDLKKELEGVYFENNKVFRQHMEGSHGDMADALCGACFNAVQSLYDTPSNIYESYGIIRTTLESLQDRFQRIH
jgi:intein/homing endonuclease